MAPGDTSNGSPTTGEAGHGRRKKALIEIKDNKPAPDTYGSPHRTKETVRKSRIKREEGRAMSWTRTTEDAAESVRNRMAGIRPGGRMCQRTGNTIDVGPRTKPAERIKAASWRPEDGRDLPRAGQGTTTSTVMTNDLTGLAGSRRNKTRLEEADKKRDADILLLGESNGRVARGETGETMKVTDQRTGNMTTIGNKELEYLDKRAEMFFLPPLVGPDDHFEPPEWFIQEVVQISGTETRTPISPPPSNSSLPKRRWKTTQGNSKKWGTTCHD
jgi:hypothetical protein